MPSPIDFTGSPRALWALVMTAVGITDSVIARLRSSRGNPDLGIGRCYLFSVNGITYSFAEALR